LELQLSADDFGRLLFEYEKNTYEISEDTLLQLQECHVNIEQIGEKHLLITPINDLSIRIYLKLESPENAPEYREATDYFGTVIDDPKEFITMNKTSSSKSKFKAMYSIINGFIGYTGEFFDIFVVDACIFNEDIELWRCTIDRAFSTSGSVFNKKIDLRNSIFKNDTLLTNGTYHSAVNLNSCEFEGRTYFCSSTFEDDVDFKNSKFRKNAMFQWPLMNGKPLIGSKSAIFKTNVYFDHVIFSEKVNFSGVLFLGTLNLNYTQFKDITIFNSIEENNTSHHCEISNIKLSHPKFYSEVQLIGTIFHNNVFVSDAVFNGNLIIENIVVKDKLSVNHTILDDLQIKNIQDINGNDFELFIDQSKIMGDAEINVDISALFMKRTWFYGDTIIQGSISYLDLKDSILNGIMELSNICNYPSNNSINLYHFSIYGHLVLSEPLDSIYECIKNAYYKYNNSSKTDFMEIQMLLLKNEYAKDCKTNLEDQALIKYNNEVKERLKSDSKIAAKMKGYAMDLLNIIGDYGVNPFKIAFFIIFIPIIFSLLFIVMGVTDIELAFHDSFTAFLTMSLGVNYETIDRWRRWLLIAEGFIGLFLMSYLVTSVARKLLR